MHHTLVSGVFLGAVQAHKFCLEIPSDVILLWAVHTMRLDFLTELNFLVEYSVELFLLDCGFFLV